MKKLNLEELVSQVEQQIDLDSCETEGQSFVRLDCASYSCWVYDNGSVDDGHGNSSMLGKLVQRVVNQMLKG